LLGLRIALIKKTMRKALKEIREKKRNSERV
jgi:hypothetical protein